MSPHAHTPQQARSYKLQAVLSSPTFYVLRWALPRATRPCGAACGTSIFVHVVHVHVAHAMDHGCSRNLRSHQKCSRDKLKHSPPTALYERFAVRSLTAERGPGGGSRMLASAVRYLPAPCRAGCSCSAHLSSLTRITRSIACSHASTSSLCHG